jgi:hypothetical protein
MDSRSEQKDSIFAVSSFATRQSFLYRQSSQSKKMTAGLTDAADVSGTAGSAIAAAVVRDSREAGLRRCDVRVERDAARKALKGTRSATPPRNMYRAKARVPPSALAVSRDERSLRFSAQW